MRAGVSDGAKVGQTGPKWDKSGLFQIFQYSSLSKNIVKSGLKNPGFVPFRVNLTHFGAKPTIPG